MVDPVGGVRDPLPAELARDVAIGHARVERAGADQRVRGDQVVEAVAAHGAQLVHRQIRLELEDAGGAAARQHGVDVGVVHRHVVHGVRGVGLAGSGVAQGAQPRLDRPHCIVDDRERLEAQEVHLEHPGVLEAVHVVLRDNVRPLAVARRSVPAPPVLRADRHVVVQRPRSNDHAGRVHRRVPRQTLERHGVVEEPPVPFVRFVERLHLLNAVDGFADGVALARLIGDHLRDPVGRARLEPENASHVADDRAALHGPEGDDLPHGIAPVLAPHVLDHLAPALIAEVDVDVRHRDAFGVQEALEDEPVRQRVQTGDPQRVRHQGARRRAPPGPHGDALLDRPADEVPGDQEVARVPGPENHIELAVEARLHVVGQRVAVALARALRGQMNQVVFVGAEAVGQGEAGQVVLLFEGERHLAGDLEGVLQNVGAVRERCGHLFGALEVEAVVVAQPVLVAVLLGGADADEDVVRRVMVAVQEVRVVGGDHRQPHLVGQREDLLVEVGLARGAVALHLQVVAVGEGVGVPVGHLSGGVGVVPRQMAGQLARHASRGDDQPVRVAAQRLAVDPRMVVEALGVPDRRQLHQVAVSLGVARQEHQVVRRLAVLARSRALPAVPGGDVRLHADDRLDALPARDLLEVPHAVKAPVVGERQRGHLVLLGLANHVPQAVRAVEQGVLGVGVQVDEGHGKPLRRSRTPTVAA